MDFVKIKVGRNCVYELGYEFVVFQKEEGDEQHYECTHQQVACETYETVCHIGQIKGVECGIYFGRYQCLQICIGRNHLIFVKEGFCLLYGFGIIGCYLRDIDVGKCHCLRNDERNEKIEKGYTDTEQQYKRYACREGFPYSDGADSYF